MLKGVVAAVERAATDAGAQVSAVAVRVGALSGATRAAMKKQPGLLDDLRGRIVA